MLKRIIISNILTLTCLCLLSFVDSYGQIPTPLKSSNKAQNQATGSQKQAKIISDAAKNPVTTFPLAVPPTTKDTPKIQPKNTNSKPSAEWWLVGLNFLLVIVVFLQWRWMNRQVIWMQKSAGVATQTLEIMQDTAIRQLRAYLSAQPNYVFNFSADKLVQIKWTTTNHGETPAYNVAQMALVDILPYPLPIDYKLPNPPPPADSTIVLHPKATINGHVYAIRHFTSDEIKQAVTNNACRIYIIGFVHYKDIFNKERRTEFCASVIGSKNLATIATGIQPEKDVEIQFQPANQYNNAD